MLKGKVKWWSNAKGFGFLFCEGKEYFCHYSAILDMEAGRKNLRENQLVFIDDIGKGEKGEFCIGVHVANPEPVKWEEDKSLEE